MKISQDIAQLCMRIIKMTFQNRMKMRLLAMGLGYLTHNLEGN
jgi:Fe2+ transport system protein FeoA